MSDWESEWRELVSGRTGAWWAPGTRAALGLLSVVYGGAVTAYRSAFDRGWLRQHRLPCPVICIGNITVGGTGKTTTVRWVANLLGTWGLRPAVLCYGYQPGKRRSSRDVTVVSGPEGLRAPLELSGDEPRLLAEALPGVPVLVGKRRVLSGLRACEEFQPDVLVLDDGFQYWRLFKDLEIVLIDAENPFGYERLLPNGMLREPLSGLRRGHVAILTHAASVPPSHLRSTRGKLARLNPDMLVAEARHSPAGLRSAATGADVPADALREGRWLALSSLGHPGSFERTLRELGAGAVVPARFPDHHAYTEGEIRALRARAGDEGLCGIVTTEKDSVKIPTGWLGDTRCLVVRVELEFLSGQDDLEALVRTRLAPRDP